MSAKWARDPNNHIGLTTVGKLNTSNRAARIKRAHAMKQIGSRLDATAHCAGPAAAAAAHHSVHDRAKALGPRCRRNLCLQRSFAKEPSTCKQWHQPNGGDQP